MNESIQSERSLLDSSLVVVNVGIELFYLALETQGVETLHVEWKPAPVNDREIIDLLNNLL